MRRRTRFASILITVALIMGSALPAMAAKPAEKHRSCQTFGSVVWAGFAQSSVPSGQIIAANTHGAEAPWGKTYSGPGSIADIVHDEMTQVDFIDLELKPNTTGEDLFGCEEF